MKLITLYLRQVNEMCPYVVTQKVNKKFFRTPVNKTLFIIRFVLVNVYSLFTRNQKSP